MSAGNAIYSYKRFNIQKEKGKTVLTAELSDLGGEPFRQIFTDCRDLGLSVIGKKHTIDFYVTHEERDEEGDLLYYNLSPAPESVRLFPEAAGVAMIIFND